MIVGNILFPLHFLITSKHDAVLTEGCDSNELIIHKVDESEQLEI